MPKLNRIFTGPRTDSVGANAAEVFKYMGLSLEDLSDIFSKDINGTASSYKGLGSCLINDVVSWNKLAKLTEKEIVIIHGHGEPKGERIRIHYPDGSVMNLRK
jgi:hypothetical protein